MKQFDTKHIKHFTSHIKAILLSILFATIIEFPLAAQTRALNNSELEAVTILHKNTVCLLNETANVHGQLSVTFFVKFTVKKVKDKIVLNWITGNEKNLSHFTVERSFDGLNFSDAGIVFTNDNVDIMEQYSFKDVLRSNSKGVVYYRLKLAGSNGQIEYSVVRKVRIGDRKEIYR